MDQRLSLITLGVRDLARARAFYEALGWRAGSAPEDVDDVLAEAEAAGARVLRRGAKTEWGGYSGVFADPDGHPWAVAHNPGWTITDEGATMLKS